MRPAKSEKSISISNSSTTYAAGRRSTRHDKNTQLPTESSIEIVTVGAEGSVFIWKMPHVPSTLVVPAEVDMFNAKSLEKGVFAAIASKQYGVEDVLAPLVASACSLVMPQNPVNFLVENVRVCKILGQSIQDSHVIKGVVIDRDTEGAARAGFVMVSHFIFIVTFRTNTHQSPRSLDRPHTLALAHPQA